jgi:hypothetical protein
MVCKAGYLCAVVVFRPPTAMSSPSSANTDTNHLDLSELFESSMVNISQGIHSLKKLASEYTPSHRRSQIQ